MNAIRTTKPDINLKARLCFYLRNDNVHWPAVYYNGFEEYLNHFQDEIDHDLKCRIAFDYVDAVKNNKGKICILRPLGKSIADYVQMEEGKDYYDDFLWGMCSVLDNEVKNPKAFFSSDEEYLEFMEALAESEKLGRGSENPSSRTWRQVGLENLAKMNESTSDSADASQDQEMADPPAQDQSSEKESASTEEQETGDQFMPDSSSAPKEATASASEAPAPQEPQEGTAEALTDDQPADRATFPAKNAESSTIAATTTINATEETPAASSSDGTSRTHNQSSSATVVSTDTSTCAETANTSEATFPFPAPEVDESMDADAISFAVCMVGWDKKTNKDGEVLHLFPGIDIETGVRGTNCFSPDELVAFVKKHNFFKNTGRELFSPITSMKKNGKQSTTPAPKTPVRTRFSPRGTRSSDVKEKIVPSDPFYQFRHLMKVLEKNFGWDYTRGGDLSNWKYVRGDSKSGKNGQYGIDYFREEREVEEYCMKHNYKGKFETLRKEEAQNFVTPQRDH
jgi:hypothetical protein